MENADVESRGTKKSSLRENLLTQFKEELGPKVRINCNMPILGDILKFEGTYDWKCIAYLEKKQPKIKIRFRRNGEN